MNYSTEIIYLSLLSLGFFGGFTHCMSMCGPFIITQVTNRVSKINIEQYSNFEKLKNMALLPYHFGRITTYCFLGIISGFLGSNIDQFRFFKYFAAILLIIAILIFLNMFFEKKFFSNFNFKLLDKVPNIAFISNLKNLLKFLFKNPTGIKGYILGIMLGFIPCGMLYSAIAMTIIIANPIFSGFGMLIFGLATIPSLFVTGVGGYFFIKRAKFKLISNVVIFINCVILLMFVIKLITN